MNRPRSGTPAAPADRPRLRILEEEDDDPVLSTINLIDVFLVVIGMLLIAVVSNPFNPFAGRPDESVTVIRNPGRPDMEIITREGSTLRRFTASGEHGKGQGEKAGTAYRLEDGRLVYVPVQAEAAADPRTTSRP